MLPPREVRTRVLIKVIVQKRLHRKPFPVLALRPVPQLIKRHELLPILRPVIVAIPIDEDAHGGKPDVQPDCHVPEEALLVDDALLAIKSDY